MAAADQGSPATGRVLCRPAPVLVDGPAAGIRLRAEPSRLLALREILGGVNLFQEPTLFHADVDSDADANPAIPGLQKRGAAFLTAHPVVNQRPRHRFRVSVIYRGTPGHDNAGLSFHTPHLNAGVLDDILAEATVVARRSSSSRGVFAIQSGRCFSLPRHIRAVCLDDGRDSRVINKGAQTGIRPFLVGKDNYPMRDFGGGQG